MEILKVINKGNLMDSYERCYIQKYSTEGICLNEQHTNNSNVLFDIILGKKVGST
jgi:hypothetical protein